MIAPGFALASAISSLTVFAGSEGCTTSMLGDCTSCETPAKSRMALDVPPTVRHLLGDPNVPLFITEGVKKADALASRGLCAVALLGVWNFRGVNDQGGKTPINFLADEPDPMVVEPAAKMRIDEGVGLINNAFFYDASQPLSSS